MGGAARKLDGELQLKSTGIFPSQLRRYEIVDMLDLLTKELRFLVLGPRRVMLSMKGVLVDADLIEDVVSMVGVLADGSLADASPERRSGRWFRESRPAVNVERLA